MRTLAPRWSELSPAYRERLAAGHFTDAYFTRAQAVLRAEGRPAFVRWQVFQKGDAVLCGVDEALGLMKATLGSAWGKIEVHALRDGDTIAPWETVILVEGKLADFLPMETIVLGTLARRTRVATNAHAVVRAASSVTPKPVLFFAARFDLPEAQAGDGYAYSVACAKAGVLPGGVSSPAGGSWWGAGAVGTIPHALEAAYGGDVARATLAFAETIDPAVARVALVDYHNDCVGTTLEVADALWERYRATGDDRFRLRGVRLDTSESMTDVSLAGDPRAAGAGAPADLAGVSAPLVRAVHAALAARAAAHPPESAGRAFFEGIGIVVSGGFTAEKIRRFEEEGVPVAAYGVGSSLLRGSFDFTADVVGLFEHGAWRAEAKQGRGYRPNERLERVS